MSHPVRPTTAGRRVSFNALAAMNASPSPDGTPSSPTRLPTAQAQQAPPLRPSFSGILSYTHFVPSRQVWHQLKDSLVCRPINLRDFVVTDASTPKRSPDYVRIVLVSDTHGNHATLGKLPAGDVLIHAGDFTPHGKPEEVDAFCAWLSTQTQFAHRLVVAGNHETCLDAATCEEAGVAQADVAALEAKLRSVCTYAKHECVSIAGLRIFASPHLAGTEGMAFNLHRRDEAHAKWAEAVPSATEAPFDVLVSHGPALGHLDFVPGLGASGCADLLDFIEAFQPTFHFCGHIHRCYGATTNNKTMFVNVSSPMDEDACAVEEDDDGSLKLRPALVVDVPRRGTAAHAAWMAALPLQPAADTMPGHTGLGASTRSP